MAGPETRAFAPADAAAPERPAAPAAAKPAEAQAAPQKAEAGSAARPQRATHTTIPLSVPADKVIDGGKVEQVGQLVMRRPRVRHVKQLIALLGPEIIKTLAGEDRAENLTKEGRLEEIGGEVIALLLSPDRLDGLSALLGDLCSQPAAVIDDLDPLDLWEVAKALVGFFIDSPSQLSSILKRD
ncbi:hypothetical protein GGD81_001391 [Rhodobium orientis]|uniref:Uncharacterized protein n=1 Tax=Rhodobium orientis TaxID=34017 RepID=A0A327JL32_9HYPH|nr:hypothetical protein [Rhodobium orientis]MBB4302364.1 hypothetical protein [Rhodobium orientis]MBK5949068.1 hypothetical protein [Rhodobium orientis]RAI26605.1 hypothetical protein CH339_13470 [Rhodobium orientis]